MRRTLIILAATGALLAPSLGCGPDEDCSEPGAYKCTSIVMKTDCPDNVFATKQWTTPLEVKDGDCGTKTSSGTLTLANDCTASCAVETHFSAKDIQTRGVCSVACNDGLRCSYDTAAACRPVF